MLHRSFQLLKQRFEFDLFVRVHQGLRLTLQGLALGKIQNTLTELSRNNEKSVLTISILSSLAIK